MGIQNLNLLAKKVATRKRKIVHELPFDQKN